MVSAEACVPSDLLPYVYHYLVENGYKKAAKAFKKETNIELATPAGADLVEIFNSFHQKKVKSVNSADKDIAVEEGQKDILKLKKKRKRKAESDDIDVSETKKLKADENKEEKDKKITIEEEQQTTQTKAIKEKKKDKKGIDN